ncbi:MAG TPA: GrpB family protein [Thermomicrobiales bacterium]|nr:GrpB family protein [Thermomicrobiales bacterium]
MGEIASASNSDPVIVVPYSAEWPERFRALGGELRRALGDVAVRIDHIGSTSVPGLAAKPVIDIQVSVESLEPFEPIRRPLEGIGYIWRFDNPDLTKRYFRERPGTARTHIHVRRQGSWSEQVALLFRDYLRCHPDSAAEYASVKRSLAERYRYQRTSYVAAKEPFIWDILRAGSEWSQAVGWEPGKTDA